MYCSLWQIRIFYWLLLPASAPRHFCRYHCIVVVLYVSLLSADFFAVIVFFLLLLASCCRWRRCWSIVIVALLLLLATASFLVASSAGFCTLSLLSEPASCCRFRSLRLIVVFGDLFVLTVSFCRNRCHLLAIVVGIALLESASHCCHCITHVGSDVSPRGCLPRLCLLFIIVIVSISLLSTRRSCISWRRHCLSWLLWKALLPC